VGESAAPPMNKKDLLILLSGSGKTDVVRNVAPIAVANGLDIVLVTSHHTHDLPSIGQTIAIEGKTKTDTNSSSLPLGSFYELNTFIFLECLLAKLIDRSPTARENVKEVAQKYRENKLVVN
jgi:D-arabinose 5-phosphate isomerase GutQ